MSDWLTIGCVTCSSPVVVDACETCESDDPDEMCDECDGQGWTIEGQPCDPGDVECHDCWTRDQVTATLDWVG